MTENVFHGITGMQFEPGNADDLVAKIRSLLTQKDPAAMRRAARACYEERYTPEVNYDMLLDIYRLAKRNAGIPSRACDRAESATAERAMHVAAATNTESHS
jgi:hypothetical protein